MGIGDVGRKWQRNENQLDGGKEWGHLKEMSGGIHCGKL